MTAPPFVAGAERLFVSPREALSPGSLALE